MQGATRRVVLIIGLLWYCIIVHYMYVYKFARAHVCVCLWLDVGCCCR